MSGAEENLVGFISYRLEISVRLKASSYLLLMLFICEGSVKGVCLVVCALGKVPDCLAQLDLLIIPVHQ